MHLQKESGKINSSPLLKIYVHDAGAKLVIVTLKKRDNFAPFVELLML